MNAASQPSDRVTARFRNVLEHIDQHLDSDLSLERLSEIAASSKFHFQRQFAALFGMGAFRYVQLARLKRAAYQLAFRADRSILDIALASAYESPEAFARAFKRVCGQAPSEFRIQPDWSTWQDPFQPIRNVRLRHMRRAPRLEEVRIVQFAESRVATLEHRGDPNRLGESIRKFIEWRKLNRLPPSTSATFNLLYDDPEEIDPELFRLDLCAAIDRDIPDNTMGVTMKVIPAGRCAVLRHEGSDDALGDRIRWLYSTWLPQSGETPRDFPLFMQRVRFYPDVPEHEALSEIFLPID